MADSLNDSGYLILASLAEEPKHGYAIMKDAREISGGAAQMRAGTLYTTLERLAEDGLITLDREEVVDSRLRRYYRISALGATALATEVDRRAKLANTARRRLRALNALGNPS